GGGDSCSCFGQRQIAARAARERSGARIAPYPDPLPLLYLELRGRRNGGGFVVPEQELLGRRLIGRREVAIHAAEHSFAVGIAQELHLGDALVLVLAVRGFR